MQGGSLEAENVIFENFNPSQEGVIQMNTLSTATPLISLKNCIFRNNTSTGTNGNIIRLQQYGANAESAISQAKIHIENCAFVNNATTYGVLFLRTANVAETYPEITVVNSTFTGNTTTNGNGGNITGYSGNQTLNIINCTLKDNTGRGLTNTNADLIMNIRNSILEGNSLSDLLVVNNPVVTISHSLINNENDPNYTPPSGYTPGTLLNDFDPETYSFSPTETSFALHYGEAQYLKNLNIYTDQLGKQRTFANSLCTAGAVENPVRQVCADCEPKDYTHLIIYGQSLSTGHESHVTLSAENVPGNHMIGDQIWINYGNSDFQRLHPLQGTRAKNATDIIESPLLGAANHIQRKGLHPNIIATSTGTSGKQIEDLSKESQVSNLYNDYTTALNLANAIVHKTNSTLTCPALFWLQGEWNYQGYGNGLTVGSTPTADKNEYKTLMVTLKNNMQNDVKAAYSQSAAPVFITYQCGSQYTKGKELAIGMAQLEASNEYTDIVCAGPVYPMTDVGGHLDANGYLWYGEMLGKVYYKTQIIGEDFKPLQPLELSRDAADAKKVIIKFLVPKLPLVLDDKTLGKITDYGFEVYNNNLRQTISDVSVSGDCVILTCAQNLTGKIEVVYAGVNAAYVSTSGNGRGSGNLRDSDDYEAVFTYQDLDKKDGSGNYIYPRNSNDASTTLHPAFEPKDAAGNVIYDQLYPLYNFSVSFYYAIPDGEQKYTVPNLTGNIGTVLKTFPEENISIRQNGKRISIFSTANTHVIVEIFDLSGRQVGNVLNTRTNRQLDLSHLSNGIYLVKVTVADETKTVKIGL
jgi:hypothetical protein